MITKPTIYTERYVKKEMKFLLKRLKDNKEVLFKKTLFIDRKYTYQRFSEWILKYKNIRKITDTKKKIDEIIESRLAESGLHSKSNPALTIFNLKNNYGWKDKQEINLSLPKIDTDA